MVHVQYREEVLLFVDLLETESEDEDSEYDVLDSLFVASVAFEPGAVQDAAKMGALLSFAAVFISIILGVLFKIKKVH